MEGNSHKIGPHWRLVLVAIWPLSASDDDELELNINARESRHSRRVGVSGPVDNVEIVSFIHENNGDEEGYLEPESNSCLLNVNVSARNQANQANKTSPRKHEDTRSLVDVSRYLLFRMRLDPKQHSIRYLRGE